MYKVVKVSIYTLPDEWFKGFFSPKGNIAYKQFLSHWRI